MAIKFHKKCMYACCNISKRSVHTCVFLYISLNFTGICTFDLKSAIYYWSVNCWPAANFNHAVKLKESHRVD